MMEKYELFYFKSLTISRTFLIALVLEQFENFFVCVIKLNIITITQSNLNYIEFYYNHSKSFFITILPNIA